MKKTTTKLILLTSITFMTACSTHSVKPNKQNQLTALQIMGVSTETHRYAINRVLPVKVKLPMLLPMAQTYPMPTRIREEVNRVQVSPIINNRYIADNLTIQSEVEQNAKNLLGVKYVWGATGPSTYDCSGFTQKVYGDAGINILRVSREQARVGQYVSFNNLRRGDMVFFDTHKRRTGKVSHVGIYLGNGNFIHASSAAKKVVIFNFNEKTFYKKRFLWGRRVIRNNYFMASL